MHTDWLGNPVTADSAATAQGISDFVEGFIAYETKAGNVLAAAEADPDSPLANAYAAIVHMFAESPAAPGAAAPFLARAEASARRATTRERRTIAAARAWADGDMTRAIAIGREGVAADPTDMALMKLTQCHMFNMGDSPGMLAIARAAEPANADRAHLHGMLAFGFEQCHLLDEAERAAHRAIEIKRKEPWAQHALAHIHLTQGRIVEGRAFLEEMSETWTGLNSFMLTHNWWHLALFKISQGDFAGALEDFDRRCWGVEKSFAQDQIGAVSLLARLELAGCDVGDRWADVAAHLIVRKGDFVNAFLSLHYQYGLARAGRPEAEEMFAGFVERARAAPAAVRPVWAEVALPAARGLLAHARGDHAACVRDLGPALPRMWECGGSHAQRDLFDQVWLDAQIRLGRWTAAQQALEMRRGFEPDSVPGNRALAMVYEHLGLPRESAAAAARARRAAAA